MAKQQKVLKDKEEIQRKINALDRDKIHILYFSYKLNFHNLYHSPLLLTTKTLDFVTRSPNIDHVAHISRFMYDEQNNNFIAKIFEATIERGMEQNDLFDKLKQFQGTCYIETINKKVDKDAARQFDKEYYGIPYLKTMAAEAGMDIFDFIKKQKIVSKKGGFCSWLTSLFLISQKIDISKIENGDPREITPADLFKGNLGERDILFQF